ncbi:MAG: hypothetical protein JO026_02705 [Patescibacteria group bacterium]|nr:hypothetical protein [Patescibacteria group bacterium]
MEVRDLERTKELHHAYVVSGLKRAQDEVLALLAARGVSVKGNPDMLLVSYPELLVDAVREEILPFAALKAFSGKKYLVITFSRANEAAQNALLKAVEEPLGDSIFFFCVERVGHLLPTILSRAITLHASENPGDSEQREEAEEFLREAYGKRLSRIEGMASFASKNQDKSKSRSFIRELILLERAANADPKTLRDLADAARYLRLQGSSVKTILGHLAVSLPRRT